MMQSFNDAIHPTLGSQVFPPSVVCRIIPKPPTIQPLFSSEKLIERSQVTTGIPRVAFFHSPSRKRNTRPLAPTIHPPPSRKVRAYNGAVSNTERSSAVNFQVLPPSSVFAILPSNPTVIPSLSLRKRTPKNAGKFSASSIPACPSSEFCCSVQLIPPSVE